MSACKVSLTLVLISLLPLIAFSHRHQNGVEQFPQYAPAFIENKGQVLDQNKQSNPDLLFLLPLGKGLNVQLKHNSFSYDTYQVLPSDTSGRSLAFHRLDISFPGANPQPEITTTDFIPGVRHFSYSVRGTVRQFRKVTYQELYPRIDLELIAAPAPGKPVEYNFILHPGARLSDIRIQYRGAAMISCDKDSLSFQMAHGQLTESIPASFWKQDGKRVAVHYKLLKKETNGVTVGFKASVDRVEQTLVIDPVPTLDWATYMGGDGEDNCRDMSMDESGNLYLVGSSNSANGIATTGTHQNILAGGSDVFIAKFDKEGTRLWSTYIGGPGDDFGQNIDLDPAGNIYVTGATSSVNGIATAGTAQINYGGGPSDGFVAKLDNGGAMLWATYFGGPENEFSNAVAADASGNVYIAGWTNSETGIATAGAHQTVFSQAQDAFLARYDANGILMWSTYYGGTGLDIGLQLCTTTADEVWISGWTSSKAGMALPGAHQPVHGGGTADAFLAQFSGNGILERASYYGGSGDDYGDALLLDDEGNIYLGGPSSSPNAIATPGAYQSTHAGAFDGFLAKFNVNGQRQWGTYYGGAQDEAVYGIALDGEGGIYLTGFTNSQSQIATTDAHQTVFHGGDWDAFLVKFDQGAQIEWGTYYGGSETDQSFAVTASGSDTVFIAGVTSSVQDITTAGSHQVIQAGGNDAFLAHFIPVVEPLCEDFNITATATAPLCEGEDLQLSVDNGFTFEWTGPVNFSSTEQSPLIENVGRIYAGSYQVIALDELGCADTAIIVVDVQVPPRIEELTVTPLTCEVMHTELVIVASGTGQLEYALDDDDFSTNFSYDSLGIGSYDLAVRDENGCITRQNLLVQAPDGPIVTALGIQAPACGTTNGIIEVTAEGERQPLRYSIDGGSSFQADHLFEGLTGGSYDILVMDAEGCTASASATLASGTEAPVIDEIVIEQSACTANQNSVIVRASSGGAQLEYSLDGLSFQAENRFSDLPAGNYTVTVRAGGGCSTTGTVLIPQLDVLQLERVEVREADCLGNNGRINIATSGGTGQLSFVLNDTIIQNDGLFDELVPGTYRWTVTDGSGCSISEVATISRGDCPIYVANAFSPNGDGVNDEFTLFSASGIQGQVSTYEIYNRWGNQLFSSGGFSLDDSGKWWDGTVNGQPAESGVYVYYLVIDLDGGEQLVESGEVLLLR